MEESFLFKFYIPRCKCSDLILPYIWVMLPTY